MSNAVAAPMTLTFSSDEFNFARARVLAIPRDTLDARAIEAECVESAAAGLDIRDTGVLNVWMSDIVLQVRSNGNEFRVDRLLLPWTLEIGEQDLARGAAMIAVPPGGVFRLTFVDGDRRPVPGRKVLAWADEITFELQMDEKGALTTFDNPTRCSFDIPAGSGLVIERSTLAVL